MNDWLAPEISDEEPDDPTPAVIDAVRAFGIDLKPHTASLRRFLVEVGEWYETARDDWWARQNDNPERPDKRLKKNWDPDEPDVPFDYGHLAGEGLDDWDQFWREHYGKGCGQPSINKERPGGPPVKPLHLIHHMTRRWWEQHVPEHPWAPKFPRSKGDEFHDPDNPEDKPVPFKDRSQRYPGNAAAMFFLIVAQEAGDQRYLAENCFSVVKPNGEWRKARMRE